MLYIGYDSCRSGRIVFVVGDGVNKMKIIIVLYELKIGDVVIVSRGKL